MIRLGMRIEGVLLIKWNDSVSKKILKYGILISLHTLNIQLNIKARYATNN